MAARYSYSSYQVADPLAQYQYDYQAASQSGPRRFFSAVGRFFYRLILLTLILGAVGGVLFALYRNDILQTIARGAGVEAQYTSLEQRLGARGWGIPGYIDLPPRETPAVAASPVVAADEAKEAPSKPGETVQAAATSEPKRSTADGLPIVSFDSLPTTAAKAAPEAVSSDALPAAEPAKVARAEPAPVRERPRAQRPAKAEKAEKAKPVELTRSIPLLKPKPEPVAKAEPPAPKPEPPAPKPEPEVDRSAPRASDNPLKAAIRAAMTKK